jgi:predicted short-subunit dehydrogenase-like oxidoreductase (DUF2520 family)
MISKRSKIAFIGAGKIAYSLIYAFRNAGYNVNMVVSNSISSAKNLAKKFSIENYSNDLSKLNSQIKIFFLTVPDNQIKIVADKLSVQKFHFKDSLFIHLSGAEDISKLDSLKKKRALAASFHIMQTFPTKRAVNFKNCYAAIETDDEYAEDYIFKLSKDLQLKPFKLKSELKSFYHLTGIFASNFLIGNIYNSEIIFNIGKSNKNNNYDLLIPLINSTLSNIRKFGISGSLSGPIERADITTIKKHISCLKKEIRKEEDFKGIYLSYLIQSLNLLNVVKSKYKKLSDKHLELKEYLLLELKTSTDRNSLVL